MRADAASPLAPWLPDFRLRTRHHVVVPAAPEEALAGILRSPIAPDRVVGILFRLRGLRGRGSIAEALPSDGFTILDHSVRTYIFGMCLRGRTRLIIESPADWAPVSERASLRIVAGFWAHPSEGGSMLRTETRVWAAPGAAAVSFAVYWAVIGRFSDLVRRRWLHAARRELQGDS